MDLMGDQSLNRKGTLMGKQVGLSECRERHPKSRKSVEEPCPCALCVHGCPPLTKNTCTPRRNRPWWARWGESDNCHMPTDLGMARDLDLYQAGACVLQYIPMSHTQQRYAPLP